MRPEHIGISADGVAYWGLDGVDHEKPILEQVEELKEDLAQVQLSETLLLDIGWYPEFSAGGRFVVSVVRDQNWDEPVFRQDCVDIVALRESVAAAMRRVESDR